METAKAKLTSFLQIKEAQSTLDASIKNFANVLNKTNQSGLLSAGIVKALKSSLKPETIKEIKDKL